MLRTRLTQARLRMRSARSESARLRQQQEQAKALQTPATASPATPEESKPGRDNGTDHVVCSKLRSDVPDRKSSTPLERQERLNFGDKHNR
jgi:hypothetical protein